jgi:thiol-disulfide isomerase/thioredoxin
MRAFQVLSLGIVSLLVGCATPQATVVYSLQDLECSSCLKSVAMEVGALDGVVEAKADKHKVEVSVSYASGEMSPESLDAVVAEQGYTWKREAGAGFWAPEIPFDSSMDVTKISADGEAVDIKAHLAKGKVTVVDFYAAWCGPCRVMTHEIKTILGERSDVALRKIDIVDWDRPVVAQHLQGIERLPHVKVYGKDGALVAAITGVKKQALRDAIDKGAGPGATEPAETVEGAAP